MFVMVRGSFGDVRSLSLMEYTLTIDRWNTFDLADCVRGDPYQLLVVLFSSSIDKDKDLIKRSKDS